MAKNPMEYLKEKDEALFKSMESARELAYSDGALPRKTKILMALAIDAAHGASEGVASLAKQALAAGATKEEIFETVRVAYYISGAGSVYTAIRGLNEIL